jgi:hypothetical protein
MITWLFLGIPVAAAILLLIFFIKKIIWWEIALLIGPTAIIILLMNTVMVAYRTADTEYFGAYTTKVIYYEPWDEEVPCRHPIYCTENYTYDCGTQQSPQTCTGTRTYVCGYEHPYDVDYHEECWAKADNLGGEHSISRLEFNTLSQRFGTQPFFVELNRDYHSIDGNAYHTPFPGDADKSDVLTIEHSYTNKIKVSHSVFKFENIDEKTKKQWALYDYPQVSGMYQRIIIGKNIDAVTERKLQYLNGYYGSSKQFRMYMVFFKDQSMEVAYKQRSLWEGGNKNEFVVCIGTNKLGKLTWVKCFSWCDRPALEVEVQNYFDSTKTIDLSKFADWMPKQIENHWHRKEFKDFDYLEIELTDTQIWVILFIIVAYNVFMSIWVVKNEWGNITEK